VIAAYWGLKDIPGLDPRFYPAIPGSLADVAFQMRDACNVKDYPYIKMLDKVFAEMLYHSPSHAWATAEEMVIASVLAWEAGQ